MNFITACQYGDFESAQKFYTKNCDIDQAFSLSCTCGYFEIAKWLHSLGIDIHANGEIAFRYSCSHDNFEIAKWLYSLGADIHTCDEHAFRMSCLFGHFEIAKWLHSLGADIHIYEDLAFISSCHNNHFEIAKWLHSLGADIHAHEDSAFRNSCSRGHFKIAKWLHSLGADIHAYEDSAFISSCSRNHFEIAKWLYSLDNKILINTIDQLKLEYTKIGISDETSCIINFIKKNKKLPDTECFIDDIVVYVLFHYNLIDELQKLNLPHVSFDVVDDKIVNFTIKHLKSKSANKTF